MDRRRALGALAGVPLIGAIAGRPGMSDVDELAAEAERVEREGVTAAPAALLPALERAYWTASEMLSAGPRERVAQEAGHVAARLAVLAAWANFGLGDYTGARSWYTRARHRAMFADDVDTTVWIYARESAVPIFHAAYPVTTGALAQRGLNFMPNRYRNKHPAASLLLLRAAHAYAEAGHDTEARAAVSAAERINPGPAGSQLHLGPGEQTRVAARVFTELGDVDEADARHQAAADHQRSSGQQALLGLNRARCLAHAGQPDAAAVVATDTWQRLPGSQRSAPLRYDARRLALDLAPWRGQAHVDAYRAAVGDV